MNFIAAPPMPFIRSLSCSLFFTRIVTARYCRSMNRGRSAFISASRLSTTLGAAACTRYSTAVRPAAGSESHSPGRTCSMSSRLISSIVLGERLPQILDRLLGVDLVEELLGLEQLVGEHLDGQRRGLACASRHHALPAERSDSDEFDWPVEHLQRDQLRGVTDERRNEWHRQVDEPVERDVGRDLAPGLAPARRPRIVTPSSRALFAAAQSSMPSPDSRSVYLSTRAGIGPRLAS